MQVHKTPIHLACGTAVVVLAWALGMLQTGTPKPGVADYSAADSVGIDAHLSPSELNGCRQSRLSLADLNSDLRLDDDDWRLMKAAKGSRYDEAWYSPRADLDGDMVVTDEDENGFCDLYNGTNTPPYADHEYKCLCSHKHNEPVRTETVEQSLRQFLAEEKKGR